MPIQQSVVIDFRWWHVFWWRRKWKYWNSTGISW